MYQQREGHILVLLECPETEASAGPSSSPIMDLLHVLGWAVTILWTWVSMELSSSDLHGPASGSHMSQVAAHTAVTVGRKSVPDHGPAVATLGSAHRRGIPWGYSSCRGLVSWAAGPVPLKSLGVLLPGRHVHYRLLDPEGRNEDVDHDDDENQSRGQVVKKVQLGVLGRVVEVILDQEDEQHAHSYLQHEGDRDEDHKGHEEGEIIALLHHGLQLRRVGHEQRDVQHALRSALLVGIMVYIDGPVPQTPAGWQGVGGTGGARAQVAVELILLSARLHGAAARAAQHTA